MYTINRLTAGCLCLVVLAALAGCAKLNPNTEKQIQAALEAKKEAFKVCYEDALTRNREAQGNMALKMDIAAASGQVTKAAVTTSEIQDPTMNQCVETTASGIRLDEAPGVPVQSNYGILFSYENQTPTSR